MLTARDQGQLASPNRFQQGLVATTSFFVLFSIVGLALYGLPFFYDFFVTDYGWSRARVTSGNMISKLLVGPLFGFIVGWIVDKYGPRRMMLSGILMAAVALIGLSYTSGLWMFYLFYFFNALGYVAGGPLPNQVLISRWFTRARGRAMGFAYVGIGLGFTLVPLLAYWLIENYDWHVALRVIGFLIILISAPLAFFVKDDPQVSGSINRPSTPSIPIKRVLTNKYFYLLALGSMASIGAVGGTNQNLKFFLSLDRGIAQEQIAGIIATIGAASLIGRLLMGWLADRFPRKYVMLLIYSLVGFSIPLLFLANIPGTLYLFALIFGIGLGGDYMIIPLMAADIFGVRVLGRVMGIILTADGVAEATAPYIVAYMRDHSPNYTTGFIFLIFLAFLGAIAVMLLPKKRIVEDLEQPENLEAQPSIST